MEPRRAGLGDATSDLAQALAQQYNLDQNGVAKGVSAYTGIDQGMTQAIFNVANGGISFTALAPLLGGALIASGFGAPAGAIVAAVLPVFDKLVHLFFGGGEDTCNSPGDYKVHNTCFHKTHRPYGPDSPDWMTFSQFRDMDRLKNSFDNSSDPSGHSIMDGTFPYYRRNIWCALEKLWAQAFTDNQSPIREFLIVYYHMWEAGAEFSINGYKPPNPLELLITLQKAWNATHSSSSTYVIKRFGPGEYADDGNAVPSCAVDAYARAVVSGAYTGIDGSVLSDSPDLTINTGPKLDKSIINVPLTKQIFDDLNKAKSRATVTSAGQKVVYTTLGIAGTAALGSAIYAYATKQSFVGLWKGWYRKVRP